MRIIFNWIATPLPPKTARNDRKMVKLGANRKSCELGIFLFFGGFATAISAQQGGPPPSAFQACNGKTSGISCTMNTPRGRLSGTCQSPRGVGGLVCVPAGHGKQPQLGQKPNSGGQGGRPPMRKHTVTQSSGLGALVPATENPITKSMFSGIVDAAGRSRTIRANAISNHKTGQFPNSGNPHRISEQNYSVRIPARPQMSGRLTEIKIPGFAMNGVPFDPGAAEFYLGNPRSGWQYNALSGAIKLGLDINHAHVQPSGKYHYHGLPTLLMRHMGVTSGKHSPQIGWAMDGFPIYALYGHGNSKNARVSEMRSSYRVKSGNRPSGASQPGGRYDGTFIQDFEYVAGLGNLDECNGIWTITPEFPNGTYAYFLTQDYPVVPRCLKGANPTILRN